MRAATAARASMRYPQGAPPKRQPRPRDAAACHTLGRTGGCSSAGAGTDGRSAGGGSATRQRGDPESCCLGEHLLLGVEVEDVDARLQGITTRQRTGRFQMAIVQRNVKIKASPQETMALV